MILDSSAILAILLKEPERDRMGVAIGLSKVRRISSTNLFEAAMVIESRSGDKGGEDLDELVTRLNLEIAPFTASQAGLARDAFRRFGKGRHPARLNFGDCFAYALAKESGQPLLYKGNDFSQTDIEAAPY